MIEMIYGIHTVSALLEQDPQRFLVVFIIKGRNDYRLQKLINNIEETGISIQVVNRKWLDNQVNCAVHQGIIAKVRTGIDTQEDDLPALLKSIDMPFLLLLDGVTDPHNLGACLRSAYASGVHAVIVPRNRAVQLNATVKKVACGAAEKIPLICVTNLARTLRLLQEMSIWVIGTSIKANHTLYQSKITGPIALVMGSENKGIRHLTYEYCDELISIPMASINASLNVSVATGVCLFEVVRQRLFSTNNP